MILSRQLKPSWRHRRLASFEKGPLQWQRLWKRRPPKGFGKDLSHGMPLDKGCATKSLWERAPEQI